MPLNKVLNKIIDLPEAESLMKVWKSQGKEVVFTNGCFDILHRGHVVYLAKAAGLGDKLMVAVNSDASVKRLGKGENRPINPAESRALLIAALGFVDAVIVFDEDTPFNVIKTLVPSVLVKGADYDAHCEDESNKKYIVGSKEVREAGGSVRTIDLEEGYSTTNIIQKAKGN